MPEIAKPLKRGRVLTGPQILFQPAPEPSRPNQAVLYDSTPHGWYQKVRKMRKDPTIAMVRQLVIAPAMLSPWSFEEQSGAPEGSGKFIEEQLAELRTYLVRTALFGCIDYGWQSFEKIFATNDQGQIVLKKMKSLLPDYTDILVRWKTGAFAGLRQAIQWRAAPSYWIYISTSKSFVHAFDIEGTFWYGQSLMENVEVAYEDWLVANDANTRYDKKIAGSHWVVHYPMGVSTVNGAEKNNEEIAQDILGSLQSSGGIAVPKKIEEFLDELNKETPNAWEIELISDKGATQTGFLDRMAYLDKLKVRGLGFPERSILEGKYGTKAEAETHADFAVTNILLRTEDFIRDLNWHLVDQLLSTNYGPDVQGSVRIKPGSIGYENKRFLRDIYMKLIANPKGFVHEFSKVDFQTLRKILAVPVDPEREDDQELFEELYDKLMSSSENGDDNGVLDEDGLGNGIREGQPGEVGRPRQFRESGDDPDADRLGDSLSRREDRRPTEGQ